MSKEYYVDKKQFYEALKEHKRKSEEAKQKGLPAPRVSNYIGKCILLIAQKLSNSKNFVNYTFKDEMISDGIENCILYLDRFDPARSEQNPFAYFTQIIYFAFLRRIEKEKKQQYVKHKTTEQAVLFDMLVDGGSGAHFEAPHIDLDTPSKQKLYEKFDKKPSTKKAKK